MTGHSFRSFIPVMPLLTALLLMSCSQGPKSQNTNAPTASSEPPAYEGYYDITNCNAILAWAWDMNRPNEAVKVDIYDGDTLLATLTADALRDDLLKNGKGNGKHGVFYPTPPQLKDGKPHLIRIKFAGTGVELRNGPKELNCKLTD